MTSENGAAWYKNYSLFQSSQESLFKGLPLSSAACLSLVHSSLKMTDMAKNNTWKQLGAISCDLSPQPLY